MMDKIAEYREAMKRAERLALELDAAMDARPRSPKLTGLPRSGQNATLDLQMEIIEAAQLRFDAARIQAMKELDELEDMIDRLPDLDQKRVLYFKHIYRLRWAEVADRMQWSERTVRRIHAQAVRALAEKERSEE